MENPFLTYKNSKKVSEGWARDPVHFVTRNLRAFLGYQKTVKTSDLFVWGCQCFCWCKLPWPIPKTQRLQKLFSCKSGAQKSIGIRQKNPWKNKKRQKFTDSLKRKPTGFLVRINSIATTFGQFESQGFFVKQIPFNRWFCDAFFGKEILPKLQKRLGWLQSQFFSVNFLHCKKTPPHLTNSSPIFFLISC